jgi:hypothetical protein
METQLPEAESVKEHINRRRRSAYLLNIETQLLPEAVELLLNGSQLLIQLHHLQGFGFRV